MKNIFFLMKMNRFIRSERLKKAGIFFLHSTKKRYIGIFLDPVLACNLRCRMCYFSDEEKRKQFKGKLTAEELTKIADAFYHRALKLQIGCGAEPTLYPHNADIIRQAKERNVPYISMTTNGNLLDEDTTEDFIVAGLNEITLSLHGVNKESYEYFMPGASYETFHKLMTGLTNLKNKYPDFKVRINYTVNKDNLEELKDFFKTFGNYRFDILQVRPIQDIGQKDYNNLSWNEIFLNYDEIISQLISECKERNIISIAPTKNDLIKKENKESNVVEQTYCYISKRSIWHDDFDLEKDTFESYSKKVHLGRKYFKMIWRKAKHITKRNLNYDIV